MTAQSFQDGGHVKVSALYSTVDADFLYGYAAGAATDGTSSAADRDDGLRISGDPALPAGPQQPGDPHGVVEMARRIWAAHQPLSSASLVPWIHGTASRSGGRLPTGCWPLDLFRPDGGGRVGLLRDLQAAATDSAADQAALAADTPPPSLMSDTIHPGPAGTEVDGWNCVAHRARYRVGIPICRLKCQARSLPVDGFKQIKLRMRHGPTREACLTRSAPFGSSRGGSQRTVQAQSWTRSTEGY
ncbi:hypothetical protein [Paracoccus mutanolyticus]|uniref:hypothetical protein n=1 Tax=Paracoccus mutanolyticus TaxID=1499308 RepID=UPI001CB94D21|nr:hypothetical protein [Paracoccus mutanolyticus]